MSPLRILRVSPGAASHPDAHAHAIAEAAKLLARGGLVAFPTETVYGLGALATDGQALARVFAAKGRPTSHPLIAHVLDEAQARLLASEWNGCASRLAAAFWPGPLTLVVPRAPGVPSAIAGGGDSIAVRAPSHPVARALLAALGAPIAAPSANRYQALSPTRAEHVARGLGDRIDLLLDGGPCAEGIESTVVDVRGDVPRVLRLGAVSVAALRAVVPSLVVAAAANEANASSNEAAARPSPGMDPRHYAPRARLHLEADRAECFARVRELQVAGGRPALVVRGDLDPRPHDLAYFAALPDEPRAYASLLFAALHEADEAAATAIVVERVPHVEAWSAIEDRLTRGAALAAPRAPR